MRLEINNEEKKMFFKNMIKHNFLFRTLSLASKCLLATSIAGTSLYAVLNILIPSWSIVRIRGIEQKDIFSIVINSALIFSALIVMSFFCKVFIAVGMNIKCIDRVNEELTVDDHKILYVFRNRHSSFYDSRNIICIEFEKIKEIEYHKNTAEIIFKGYISSDNIEKYNEKVKIIPNGNNLKEFTIFDYFDPTLKEVLIKNRISLKEKEN